jgi:hypothetical protein
LAALASTSLAQEEMQCRGLPIKFTDHQKAQIMECLDAAGIKTVWKIPADKLACFGVCILEKKEMLTADGKINHAKALKYIDAVMPDQYKKPLIDGVDQCIKDHGDKVKMDGDKACMSFMEVGQCVHDVFLDICVE